MSCESKKKSSFVGHDLDTHDLVRCSVFIEPAEVMLEERLADIENRLEKHETHIDEKLEGLELKMGERLSRVDQRLSEMERLLRDLISTLGPRPKPSGLPAYPQVPSYVESYP
jgi:CII-binding regulator of phage lambda lysogenization HflD